MPPERSVRLVPSTSAKGRNLQKLIDALLSAGAYPHRTRQIVLIETHISWVILTGDFAYKIKKPVKLPFLDFTTLESRRRFCNSELRLNRRLSAELYLDVVPIGGEAHAPRVGATPAFEYAVRMVQFPVENVLDEYIGRADIPIAAVRNLAERLAMFHAELRAVANPGAESAAIRNLEELRAVSNPEIQGRLRPIEAWTRSQFDALAERLRERQRGGAIRECHGDLHLGNLLLTGSQIIPFDCLEFDRSLRCIDTLSEIAFTVMDFMAHHRADLGIEFLNRYLEISGDYAGLHLLRFYLVYRALVRTKVHALQSGQWAARGHGATGYLHLELAERAIEKRTPVLVITHGLSGSGKTTLTSQLVAQLPSVRVRSDLERKRLFGLGPIDRRVSEPGRGLYTKQITEATYAALFHAADAALSASFDIIVDAAFLRKSQRDEFAGLAERHAARFVILDCVAEEAVLRERISTRFRKGCDASDADVTVLEHQLATAEAIGRDEADPITIDTTQPVEMAALARRIMS